MDFTIWAGPWGVSFTRNLTSDKETGLGSWTDAVFIKAMRTGKDMGEGRPILPPMPWEDIGKLPDADLKAMFAYLQSVPPVKNAVIWIEKIAEGKKFPPHGAAVLRQKKCEYDPHVLLLRAGEDFEIVNDDPLLHNVHTYDMASGSRSMFNIAQPVRGARTKVNPDHVKGCGPIMATCDAGHPWMNAYIVRAPHPYYAVTDGEGRFRLDDVPPGTYTLTMWHEGIATHVVHAGAPPAVEEQYIQTKQVVVQPYGGSNVDFSFPLRSVSASK